MTKKQTKTPPAKRTANQTKGEAKRTARPTANPAAIVQALEELSGETAPAAVPARGKWIVDKYLENSTQAERPTEEARAEAAALRAALADAVGLWSAPFDANYPPRLKDGREWIDREEELETAVSALPKDKQAVADAFCRISGLDSLYDASAFDDDAAFESGAFCLQVAFRVSFLNLAARTDAGSMRAALSALPLSGLRDAAAAFEASPSAETWEAAQELLDRALEEWDGRCLLVAPPAPANAATPPANAEGKAKRTRGRGGNYPADVKQAVLDWLDRERGGDVSGEGWRDAFDAFSASPDYTARIRQYVGSPRAFKRVAEAARKARARRLKRMRGQKK